MQGTAWAGVAGCEERVCSFGVGDGCFEIFDADGDMEVVFCEEIFEVFFVDGDGGVNGLFEYFFALCDFRGETSKYGLVTLWMDV